LGGIIREMTEVPLLWEKSSGKTYKNIVIHDKTYLFIKYRPPPREDLTHSVGREPKEYRDIKERKHTKQPF
jgi:hypothetical protein